MTTQTTGARPCVACGSEVTDPDDPHSAKYVCEWCDKPMHPWCGVDETTDMCPSCGAA